MSIANKIVVGLVGLTVMAVVFSAMLPIMGEVTSAEDTFTNNGIIRMSKVDNSYNATIIWDHTKPYKISLNDIEKDLPQELTIALTIGGIDDYFIRYMPSSKSMTVFHNNVVVNSSVNDGTDMTITISEGTITSSNGSYTDTFTYTDDLFIISDNGPYVMKNPNDTVYVKGNSDIHAYGRTYLSGGIETQSNFNINGSIADGFVIEPWGSNATLTIPSYNVTDEIVNGYDNLYKFTKIDFTVSDGEHTTTSIYGQVIVPYSVTAEKSVHPDGPTTAILNMLPIIIGAGLLLGAIAFMIVTRK